jgi:phosphoglycerate kinase
MSEVNNITNSKVLVRVCFDLSNLQEIDRIQDSVETIKILLKNNNKVVLATHWGRPNNNEEYNIKDMLTTINKVFEKNQITEKLEFFDQTVESFEEIKDKIESSQNQLFILQNTRYLKDEQSKEVQIRKNLAKKYALLVYNFVDEAFPVSHRQEATNSEIKEFIPSFFGISFNNEIQHLNNLKNTPNRPFVFIMAGAKLETKLPLIQKMLPKADKVLVGGMLAFTFIKAASELYPDQDFPELFSSKIETDFLATAKDLLINYKDKLILPKDFVYGELFGPKEIFDIGKETLAYFKSELATAKTVFWNGTLGYYEQPPYNMGTLDLADYVANLSQTFKVMGGGDTNSALPENITSKFDFVSMGGGATIEFLSK